jgi:hypothetical protein
MGKQDGGVGLADRTRDACLHKLGDHYAAGRLTAQELDSRIQVALSAETEAELTEVMADLETEDDESPDRSSSRSPGRGGTPRSSVVRWAAGLLVVAAGSVLLAVVGPGPAAAELAVGLTGGLLGYLTHWWLTRQATPPSPVAERPTPTTRPRPPVLRDEGWRPEDSDEAMIEAMSTPDRVTRLRSIRPLGRGSGVVPTQRTGD